MRWIYSILFWIPFAFAVVLSEVMLEDRDSAWPAFYGFLPMTFFFTGAAFMELVRRIRKLENRLKLVEGQETAGAQSGTIAASSLRPQPPAYFENEIGLFGDPIAWSGSMVRTWPRFGLFGLFFTILLAFMIFQAAHWGWRAPLGLGISLGMFQLMILYALRRLFLRVSPGMSSKN
jgi:hypothetical protein